MLENLLKIEKKSLKIVSLVKNLAIQAQSLLRANKPFAGKFAKDWKKITENSLIREKSSITGPKSALKIWDIDLLANEDSNFGSIFLEFE